VAGAALCSLMSVPASAMPMSNLAAAASDLALGQSVRYVRHHYRYRLGRGGYYPFGAVSPPRGRAFGGKRNSELRATPPTIKPPAAAAEGENAGLIPRSGVRGGW